MSIVRFVPLHDCSRFLFGQFSVAIGSMRPELIIATSGWAPETGGGGFNRSSSPSAKQKPRGGLKTQTFNVHVETFIVVPLKANPFLEERRKRAFMFEEGRAACSWRHVEWRQ